MCGGSGINGAHPVLELLDHRAALGVLARHSLHRRPVGSRHWMLIWLAIPEPFLFLPAAWEPLYRRVHPRLRATARRRLPTVDIAEDAVSETMARAWP